MITSINQLRFNDSSSTVTLSRNNIRSLSRAFLLDVSVSRAARSHSMLPFYVGRHSFEFPRELSPRLGIKFV